MITTQSYNSLNSSGIKSAVAFGIKDSGLAHIFNVLRNQLYTDKIGAVVREYSANAYDANVEAGNGDKSIRITLPSPLEKVFKVRDFGRGLSQQDIHEVYCFYGESTKRQSNAYIGQLGLGSKSAFAYGDNFLINSYTDGTLSSYNAFIDPSGIGQIALLASKPTDEPNGVEICIAVKGEDCTEFNKSVRRYLRYFKVKPEIIGMNDTELEEMFRVPLAHGQGWGLYKNSHVSTAVMGNIGYPIAISSMKLNMSLPEDKKIHNLLSASITLDFQIGDLDVAASREGLQYTDRTLLSIRKLCVDVVDKLTTEIENNINTTAKSIYGAKKMFFSMDNLVDGFYHLRQILEGIRFKGMALSNNYCDVSKTSKDGSVALFLMKYDQNWNSNVRATRIDSFHADSRSVVVFNDMGNYNSGARAARYLASTDKDKRVFLFTPQVRRSVNGIIQDTKAIKANEFAVYAKQIQEVKHLNGFCDEDFTLASSIVIPANNLATGSKKAARTGVLTFSVDNSHHYYNRKSWQDATADIKGGNGIYVQICNYQAVLHDQKTSNSTLADMVKLFPTLKTKQIVGMTGTQLKKIGSGWVHLFDAMKEEYEGFIKSKNINLESAIANKVAKEKIDRLPLRSIPAKVQGDILNGIKDKNVIRILNAVFASLNEVAESSDIQKAMAMYNLLIVRNTTNKVLVNPSRNAVKIADCIFNEAKGLVDRFPLLHNLDYTNFRWGNPQQAVANLVDYFNR